MNRTFTIFPALTLLLILAAGCGEKVGQEKTAPSVEETTLTKVGQSAPDFTVATLNGGAFSLSDQRGRVVLVNWFATWCQPCIKEMPHLQKEVWEEFRGSDFTMVSVAREETLQVVQPFVLKHELTWPFALDPHREAYARYAAAYIPRNQVINREGEIIFQSQGFEKEEFETMIRVIRKEIGAE